MTLCKYPLLDDFDKLHEEYIEKQASIKSIARSLECNPTTVRYHLRRHNIPLRDKKTRRDLQINSRENHLILDKSVIEGGLLGDGCMVLSRGKGSLSDPYYKRKNKFRDHVRWVGELLYGEFAEERVKCGANGFNIKGEPLENYYFRTLTHSELRQIYDRWYPDSNGQNKIVPKDFVLDSVSLLHWFLDDGYSTQRRKESVTKQIVVGFATDSFSYTELEYLCQQMLDLWKLRFRIVKHGINKEGNQKYQLYLAQSQADLFFSIIGPPPVPSLAYKWK